MEWYFVLIIIMALFGIFLLSGMPLVFVFFLTNTVGLFLFVGGVAAWNVMISGAQEILTSYPLLAVLFFILMGEIIADSGIMMSAITELECIIGGIHGNLSYVSIAAGTLLGACSGASMGSTAALATTLMPVMRNRGYSKTMSLGPIIGGGSLDNLIPPAFIVVVLASLAGISAGKLLIASVIPGLLAAALMALYIMLRIKLKPSLVPPITERENISISRKIASIVKLLPLGFIIFAVLVTVFIGVATPTEASALGVGAALILAACYRKLTLDMVRRATLSSGLVCGLSLIIVMGSKVFSQLMAGSGIARGMVTSILVLNLPGWNFVVLVMLIALVMGCFLDGLSILMIVIPLFMPVAVMLGFDPFWFGILLLINVTIGMLTPPFGLLLFVMKGVCPEDTFGEIVMASIPYMVILGVVMLLTGFLPCLTLWLPGLFM